MAKKKTSDKAGEPASFETALAELEEIVGQLAEGKTGLNDALQRYEQGVALLQSCYQLLENAERKIELLSGVDADGNPVVAPLDHESEASQVQAGSSQRVKTKRKGRKTRSVDDRTGLF